MKLVELNPRFKGGYLSFDCPNCKDDKAHSIRVAIAPQVGRDERNWQANGEFPDFTLSPSIDAGCWHGNIVAGEIVGGLHAV